MFSSLGLFDKVQCPEQSHCSLVNCIFSHHAPAQVSTYIDCKAKTPPPNSTHNGTMTKSRSPLSTLESYHDEINGQDQQRKRRRLSTGNEASLETQSFVHDRPRLQPLAGHQAQNEVKPSKLPVTGVKEVSPPPTRAFKTKAAEHLLAKAEIASSRKSSVGLNLKNSNEPSRKTPEISLNPRLINNPPAPHAVRMQLVALLHEQMSRLNDEVCKSSDPAISPLRLSTPELIMGALEEEETVAKQNSAIYLNVVKLRITRLKKMKLAEWKEFRLRQIERQSPSQSQLAQNSVPAVIDSGLSTSQEIAFLSMMFAKQTDLTKYGYVATSPSDAEVAKAHEGVKAGLGWEQCDRCKTRFQVFPGRRREDGALTSGGTCSYHPAKPRRPPAKDNADKGHRESIYACCNEAIGTSVGCTTALTHVFKVSDPKRLALIMPFKNTPPKMLTPGPNRAVCFDCEMGYTTMGLELIRLTATSWPDGKELLDVLVRPLGEILDLNSRYSGVWPKDYIDALPYKAAKDDKNGSQGAQPDLRLRLVESPAEARGLLFDLLTPETPLIGHALDNDLNATRVIHPSIVDSVLLYAHPRGLPIRFGLKVLMKTHLGRDIQMGGANGHDSKEDARAAGDLVRLKVANKWKAMQRDGWTARKQEFYPPLPLASATKKASGPYVGGEKTQGKCEISVAP